MDARTQELIATACAVAVKAALAAVPSEQASSPPAAALPAWCSVAMYAVHVGVTPKTVRNWALRAPPQLVAKYGRGWRLAGPAFDAWVRAGGPFRQHEEETRVH